MPSSSLIQSIKARPDLVQSFLDLVLGIKSKNSLRARPVFKKFLALIRKEFEENSRDKSFRLLS
ncbi:hypothetical protein LguiA_003316 [Lonicera macranthoides]